mmetsp:Transcript_7259/g.18362  ORF Transcript_7259/g.18362 Transcript_7259/m.18362 type:complete len:217 (-) Transcript_7259:257-907(-)
MTGSLALLPCGFSRRWCYTAPKTNTNRRCVRFRRLASPTCGTSPSFGMLWSLWVWGLHFPWRCPLCTPTLKTTPLPSRKCSATPSPPYLPWTWVCVRACWPCTPWCPCTTTSATSATSWATSFRILRGTKNREKKRNPAPAGQGRAGLGEGEAPPPSHQPARQTCRSVCPPRRHAVPFAACPQPPRYVGPAMVGQSPAWRPAALPCARKGRRATDV